MANELKLDNPLARDMKPIKVNDKSTGLLISDSNVFVESQPTEENHVATKKYVDDNAGGGSVALNDLTDVAYSSGDLTISSLDKIIADDFVVDSAASIELDSNSGNFVAKKAGTEFSATNSAYAGMVLGYTYLHPTDGTTTHEIQNSMTVEDSAHQITFKTPPSEFVEIELSCFINVSSTDTNIDVGLSDNSTYNSIGAQFEYDFAGVYFTDDEVDDDILTVKWVLGASELASIGSSNTFYIGFSTAGSTKTANISYGLRSSHGVSHPPFIIKATALPASIYTG